MWRRLSRRTFGPRRPLLYRDQYLLALVTAVVIAFGLVLAAQILF